jgi:hypothetical protein
LLKNTDESRFIILLFFKENIYLPATEDVDREDPEPLFDPYSFVMQALVAEVWRSRYIKFHFKKIARSYCAT